MPILLKDQACCTAASLYDAALNAAPSQNNVCAYGAVTVSSKISLNNLAASVSLPCILTHLSHFLFQKVLLNNSDSGVSVGLVYSFEDCV